MNFLAIDFHASTRFGLSLYNIAFIIYTCVCMETCQFNVFDVREATLLIFRCYVKFLLENNWSIEFWYFWCVMVVLFCNYDWLVFGAMMSFFVCAVVEYTVSFKRKKKYTWNTGFFFLQRMVGRCCCDDCSYIIYEIFYVSIGRYCFKYTIIYIPLTFSNEEISINEIKKKKFCICAFFFVIAWSLTR